MMCPSNLCKNCWSAEWQSYGMFRRATIHSTIEKIFERDWRTFDDIQQVLAQYESNKCRMILDQINITNFGLYKGSNSILLTPNLLGNRNITVLSGQNGVGKSTLLEAIHLCLLGSLSIDNRLSEANYEKYLFKRSYKNSGQQIINSFY